MKQCDLFKEFDGGVLLLPDGSQEFSQMVWNKHPAFEGVELKHIISGEQTNHLFSYHLVKIAPGKSIGMHVHEQQLETHEVIAGKGHCTNDGIRLEYKPGVISIFPAEHPHEVAAGEDGLYLFAKFMPALC